MLVKISYSNAVPGLAGKDDESNPTKKCEKLLFTGGFLLKIVKIHRISVHFLHFILFFPQ